MKLANLSKILKCAGNDDAITMKSEDNGDTITFMFETPSEFAQLAALLIDYSSVLPPSALLLSLSPSPRLHAFATVPEQALPSYRPCLVSFPVVTLCRPGAAERV